MVDPAAPTCSITLLPDGSIVLADADGNTIYSSGGSFTIAVNDVYPDHIVDETGRKD